MAICAVFGCCTNNDKNRKKNRNNSNGAPVKLFRFPKDPNIAKIWEYKCGRRDEINVRTAYICSKHFTGDQYLRNLKHELLNYCPKSSKSLKEDAIPTENLPLFSPSKNENKTETSKQHDNNEKNHQDEGVALLESNDDEVARLLQSWGLSDLKAKFKANYIVLQALEYLTEDDIVELIPKIGQRAIFRGRLLQWRQQNGFTTSAPPIKVRKQEPVNDTNTEQQVDAPNNNGITTSAPLIVCKQEPVSDTNAEQHDDARNNDTTPAVVQHQVYGTLTKCTPKTKKIIENTLTKTAMQSKVQQFYISPVIKAPTPPPPPPPPPALPSPPPLTLQSSPPVLHRLEPTPFVTSIIRVETNCSNPNGKNNSNANPQSKVRRTTILQKLTNALNPKTSSPTTDDQIDFPQDITDDQNKQDEQPEDRHLYPIIKLETALADVDWDPEPEPEPEPELLPEPKAEKHEEEEATVDSTDYQTEYIESLGSDSGPEFDSENDNSTSRLDRIAPEVNRRRGKRKHLGKLDIRNILMNSDMGRHVLNFYEANERLDVGRRRMLIEAIARDCWLAKRHICPKDCFEISEEIIEILPNERMEDYYVEEKGKSPKSPLYNKFRSMGKVLPVNGLSAKRKKPRLTLEMDDIEIDDSIIIS